ncbi:MAG: IS630 family transposase [Actinobacteria bacterium]|nr:IS630 family transposase [Actinomycetota bacterium]
MKKYVVTLTAEERAALEALTRKGTAKVRRLKRALVLLSSAEGDPDVASAGKARVSVDTVERIRRRFVEEGLEAALAERPRPGKAPALDGRGEAYLLALACSAPPPGRGKWTMRLLADRLVELGMAEAISDETVRRVLQKGGCKPWQRKQWCFPTIGAEYVAAMEDVLDLYEEAYDPARPVVCFDELPYQLVAETRAPRAAQPGHPARYDYEYRRNGTANLFMLFEPKAGRRHVAVTERRAAVDFAEQMKALVDEHYPGAARIRVVLDNLNTHKPASLYRAFAPAEARRLLRRLEFHYTPKHGSWLNQAEIEWSVLAKQCLDRRLPDRDAVAGEITAWERTRNAAEATVAWRFTTAQARTKLARLYPAQS